MPHPPNRELKLPPEAENKYCQWLTHLNDEFTRHSSYDLRSEIVRDALFMIYLGRPHGGRSSATLTTDLPLHVVQESFDARNVTLPAEHYGDVNEALFYPRKPLLYFWQMFDNSALGMNHWLGVHFRSMLARHIFHHAGKAIRFHRNVILTFGYNLTVEDNVRVFENVRIDDRDGPMTLKAGSQIHESIYAQE